MIGVVTAFTQMGATGSVYTYQLSSPLSNQVSPNIKKLGLLNGQMIALFYLTDTNRILQTEQRNKEVVLQLLTLAQLGFITCIQRNPF